MSRRYSPKEHDKMIRAKREFALERREIRGASERRAASSSPTGFAVKVVDDETLSMMDEFLARKRRGQ